MCGLNPRSRLVLAKLELTPGSDSGPVVGTDDLFVSMDSPGIKLGVTQVSNEPATPTSYSPKGVPNDGGYYMREMQAPDSPPPVP